MVSGFQNIKNTPSPNHGVHFRSFQSLNKPNKNNTSAQMSSESHDLLTADIEKKKTHRCKFISQIQHGETRKEICIFYIALSRMVMKQHPCPHQCTPTTQNVQQRIDVSARTCEWNARRVWRSRWWPAAGDGGGGGRSDGVTLTPAAAGCTDRWVGKEEQYTAGISPSILMRCIVAVGL